MGKHLSELVQRSMTTTYQVERRIQLDGFAEHSQTNIESRVGAKRSPRVDSLIAIILERPGLEAAVESAQDVRHIVASH